ncbi:MAG: DUF3578 domain-containing protein [Burkholderiaceae bacterium]
MRSTTELFRSLERKYVIQALKQLDAGASSRFADSIKFDLLYQGKRYPPKEVAGLALEQITNKQFSPADFSGGESSSCFRALERCGFTIVPKRTDSEASLGDVVNKILDLQKLYSSTNTPEMQQRGILIRDELPKLIEDKLEVLEPIFSRLDFQCAIEGSDGKGRKNESPWVRVYDPAMSPSATLGWYVVVHFARDGSTVYLTMSCGATVFKDGSLIKVPPKDLERQVSWARGVLNSKGIKFDQYRDEMHLGGNALSGHFEKACALVKAYGRHKLYEQGFWTDLQFLCSALTVLYEQERTGKSPVHEAPDLIAAREAIEEISRPRKRSGRGQGRGLSHQERQAIELCAMAVAEQELKRIGFETITDKSRTESYDFSALRDGIEWLVEVKGTTSVEGNSFLLTAAELRLHRGNTGRTILIIVSDIDLDRTSGDPKATGGKSETFIPWDTALWNFEPTSYQALRRLEN